MPPAERQQVAAALLRRVRDGRHRQGHGDQLVLRILDQGDVPEVDEPKIGVHVTVDDVVRQHREVEQVAIGLVDQVEDLPAVILLLHLPLGNPADVKAIALLHDRGSAGDLLRHLFRHEDAVLQPVIDLTQPQGLEMVLVVRIIVFQVEGTDVVETFHDTALIVEIREAERAGDLRHPMLLAEGDDRLEQGLGDLLVVDEIDPAKADLGMVPVAVGDLVDDSRHTAYDLTFLVVSQVLLELGILTHRVLGHVQGGHLIDIEARDIVGAVLIQLQRELDKSLEFAFRLNSFDGYRHSTMIGLITGAGAHGPDAFFPKPGSGRRTHSCSCGSRESLRNVHI